MLACQHFAAAYLVVLAVVGKLLTLVPVAADVTVLVFAFVHGAVLVFDVVQHTLLVGCKLVHQVFLTHLQVI